MNRKAFFKIALLSVSLAAFLSLCSLLFLNRAMSNQMSRFRDDFLTFYASSLEERIQKMTSEEIRLSNRDIFFDERMMRPPGMERRPPRKPPFPPPPSPGFGGMFPPPPDMPPPAEGRPPHLRNGPPHFGPEMWVVDQNGDVVASRRSKMDFSIKELSFPKEPGKLETHDDFFRLTESIVIVRLNHHEQLYLVARDGKRPMLAPLLMTQAVLTSSMIVIALAAAFAGLFFYLRRKSEEARSVLRRLEEGDLKARFEIHRFDEFGELLLDFNRMADEIEMLVGRIHSTEKKRKELLQELGHDLRTPLTSLQTNFETLQIHGEKLSVEDKNALYDVLCGEIDYFKDLIEKLMTIASLDEPHYKASTEHVNLKEILQQEIKARQSNPNNQLIWQLHDSLEKTEMVLGDSHLLLRLLRNGLDNASRYAETKVSISLHKAGDKIKITIQDDGPGLDEEAIANFGMRKEFRGRKITKGGHFSLGLGSVIMKTITDLHNGSIEISNIHTGNKKEGACLCIELPTAL